MRLIITVGPCERLSLGDGRMTCFSNRSYWIPGSYAATLSENHDSFLRLLKDNDFKEERMTKVGLYAISTSTTLESNKSLFQFRHAAESSSDTHHSH